MSNLNFLHSGGNKVTLSSPDSNPSSDITFKLPQADGSSGQSLVTNGSGTLSFATVTPTIEVDHWFLNTNTTGGIIPGTNWTRHLKIGTGMTVSQDTNGRWTFPSTGIWKITMSVMFRPDANDNVYFDIFITHNSWSNRYHYARGAKANGQANGNNRAQNGGSAVLIDIENTSTYGIDFMLNSHGGSSYTQGYPSGTATSGYPMYTTVMFERMGDT